MDQWIRANMIFSKFSRNYMEQKKNLPIRPSEMGVLNILAETPGPHTPLMLAELLGVSKPMITAHLSVLMEKGYITKQPCEEDKRAYYVLLTEKAQTLVDEAKEEMKQQLNQIMEEMGQKRFDVLVELLSEANQVLEKKRGNLNGSQR